MRRSYKKRAFRDIIPFAVVNLHEFKVHDFTLELVGHLLLCAVAECVRRHVVDGERERLADGCLQGDKEK